MQITTVTVVYAAVGLLVAAACHWRLGRNQELTAGQLHCWTLASLVFLPWFILYVLGLVIAGLFTKTAEPEDSSHWGC
jgi:phosphate/sulfate permease